MTRRGLASDGARARRAPPRALRDLSRGGRRALPVVPRRADAPVPACVRAVRIAGSVAGAALRGVRGAKARLHVGPRRDRLRPRRACPRPRVEGGRPPRSGARARSPRHRGGSQAGRRLRRSRSRRSGAGLAPWGRPASPARTGARSAVGHACVGSPRANTSAAAPTGALPRRAASERARERRPARIRGAENGVRRRRRLHVGRDRRRLRVGAPPRGSPPCERRDPRAGRSLD